MPTKTLLICSPSFALRGGVESIINDLCRELPHLGWNVVLGLGKGSRFNDVSKYRQTYPDLPIVEIDGTRGTRLSRVAALKTVIRKINPAIVLSARVYDTYAAVNELKTDNGSPRLAITIQSYEPHYFYDARSFRESVDLCVAAGNMIQAAATNWSGLPVDRVVSIPSVVRPPNRTTSPRRLGDQIRIGYVGRLDQSDKRILDLVPLIKHLERLGLAYHFRVVGDGPDRISLIEDIGSEIALGRVQFLGWKDHAHLYEHVYPELDCVVNFSPAEGVSVVGGEAMAHGVVPVFSEFIGIKTEGQYLNEINCLTFPVGDVDRAARNIQRLGTEPGLLTRLSREAAVRMHKGRYSFKDVMSAWAGSLDHCLEQSPRNGTMPDLGLPADGRLTRIGLPPATAQRVRDLMGRKYRHNDPGSEWPSGSGLMTEEAAKEVLQFGRSHEKKNEVRNRSDFIPSLSLGCL
ncbi:MAG: glycosyltransferase family 4 protein [Acidobacteriota bacterium]|nr:glycosyltransferase family 4 protein [Acidobacteriota bacterium]